MVIIGSKGCAKEILTALKWDNVEETVSLFDNIQILAMHIMTFPLLNPGMNWSNI